MNVQDIIREALKEDVGSGDITTNATVDADRKATAKIIAKQAGKVAGTAIAAQVFTTFDPSLEVSIFKADGESIGVSDVCMTIAGSARSILTAERVALNFLGEFSGVATLTDTFQRQLERAVIYDTRKMTPLMRRYQKDAVVSGGGKNHRFGLFDAYLIKENHITMAGGVSAAITRAREADSQRYLQVEVEDLNELHEVLKHNVDCVMLDNFSPALVEDALVIIEVADCRPDVEVSGGITLENVKDYDLLGVDRIAVGAITHSAPVLDFSLQLRKDQ